MDSQFKDDASRYLHNLTIFRVGAARMFGDVLEIRPNPLKNLSVGVGVSPVDGRSRKESPKRDWRLHRADDAVAASRRN